MADPPTEPSNDAPTEHPGAEVAHPAALRVGLAVTAVLVVLDQVTKQYVESVLERGEFVGFIGPYVGWQLVYNPGGAFGLPAPSWVFFVVTIVVTVVVLRTLPHTPSLLPAVAYGMLLAGALGNAIDRLLRPSVTGVNQGFFRGDVVDFVAWGTFPRFNVADSAITVGLVLLVLAFLLEERRHRREGASADPSDAGPKGADVADADVADTCPGDADPGDADVADVDKGGSSAAP